MASTSDRIISYENYPSASVVAATEDEQHDLFSLEEFPEDVDSDSFYSNYSNCSSSVASRVALYSSTTPLSLSSSSSVGSPYYWQEPIKVGYAFGAKKMSTMGVVMAEASRAEVIHEEPEEEEGQDEGVDNDMIMETEERETFFTSCDQAVDCGDGTKVSTPYFSASNMSAPTVAPTTVGSAERTSHEVPSSLTSDDLKGLAKETNGTEDCRGKRNSTIISLKNTGETDIRHIVRYFRSNCSSVAASLAGSMSETTTSTTTMAYGNGISCTNAASTPITGQHIQQRSRRRKRKSRYPVHISFVPLDCDQPLEDQHGGNFDLILHKLTEDILSCSLMKEDAASTGNQGPGPNNDPSWNRIESLQDYDQTHDYCCLVDHPSNVQTVMSRSDIAHVLRDCLQDVYSTSGIPVRSPRFVVIDRESKMGYDAYHHESNDVDLHDVISPLQAVELRERLQEEDISMPIIVKPLIAAGTKQSHFMLIAMKESALCKLPCLSIAQEYVNHNAKLYKVYVLGDFVSVFERPSLPNLPDAVSRKAATDLIDFDSQRPYPKLKDFGLKGDLGHQALPGSESIPDVPVTVDEVKPIVDVLKHAFGLELFGFDILRGVDGEFLVVDVNYFPSYKEVENFPFLLAQYLTQRVLEQRRNKREADMTSMHSGKVATIATTQN